MSTTTAQPIPRQTRNPTPSSSPTPNPRPSPSPNPTSSLPAQGDRREGTPTPLAPQQDPPGAAVAVSPLDQTALADAVQAQLVVTHFDARNCSASKNDAQGPGSAQVAAGFNLTLSVPQSPPPFNATPWLLSWAYPASATRPASLRRSWTSGNQSLAPVERSVSLAQVAPTLGTTPADLFSATVLKFADPGASHWVMFEMTFPCSGIQPGADVMTYLPASVILWSVNATERARAAAPPVAVFTLPSSLSAAPEKKHVVSVRLATTPLATDPQVQPDAAIEQLNTDASSSPGAADANASTSETAAATSAFIAMLVLGGAVLVTVVTVVVCWCRASRKHVRETKRREQLRRDQRHASGSSSKARRSSVMVYAPGPGLPPPGATASPPPPRPARSTGDTSGRSHPSSSMHSHGSPAQYRHHPYAASAGLEAARPSPPQVSFANHPPPGLPSPTEAHPSSSFSGAPVLMAPEPTAAVRPRPNVSIDTDAGRLRKRDSTTQTGTPPPVHVVVHRDAATSPLDPTRPPPRITILTPSPSVLSSLGSDPSVGGLSTVAVVGSANARVPPVPPIPNEPVQQHQQQQAKPRQSEVERLQEKALFDQLSDLLRLHEEQQAARKARAVGPGGNTARETEVPPTRTHESMRPMPGFPQSPQARETDPKPVARDPYRGFPPSRQPQHPAQAQAPPEAPRRPAHDMPGSAASHPPPAGHAQFPIRGESHHHMHQATPARTTPPPTRNHSRPTGPAHPAAHATGRRRSSSFGSRASSTPRNSLSLDRLLKSSADASGSYYDAVLHDLRTALPPTPPPPEPMSPPTVVPTTRAPAEQPIPPPPMDGPVPNVPAPSSPIVPRFFVAPPRPGAGEGEARKKPPSLVIPTIFVSPPSISTPSVDYPPYFDDDDEDGGEGEDGEEEYDDEEDEEEYYRQHGGYMDEDDGAPYDEYYGHYASTSPTAPAIVDSDLTSDEDPALLLRHYPSSSGVAADIEVISPTSSMDDDEGSPPPPAPHAFPAAAQVSSALAGAVAGAGRRPSGSGPVLTYGASSSSSASAYATPVVPVVPEKSVPAAASAVVWSSNPAPSAAQGPHMYHQQQPVDLSGASTSPAALSSSAGSFSISKMYPSSGHATTDISDTEDDDDFVLHMSTPPPASAPAAAARGNQAHAWHQQPRHLHGPTAGSYGRQEQPVVASGYKQSPPQPTAAYQPPSVASLPQPREQQPAAGSSYKQSPPQPVVYQSPAAASSPPRQQVQQQPPQPSAGYPQAARRAPPPSPINTTWNPPAVNQPTSAQAAYPTPESGVPPKRSIASSQHTAALNDTAPPPRRTAIPTSAAMAPLVQHFGHQISTAAHAHHQYRVQDASIATKPAGPRPPPLPLQQPTKPVSSAAADQPPILSPRPRRSFPDLARRVELAAMAAQQERVQAQQQQQQQQQQQVTKGYVPAPQYVNPNRGKQQQASGQSLGQDDEDPFSAPGAVVWSTNAGYVSSGQR